MDVTCSEFREYFEAKKARYIDGGHDSALAHKLAAADTAAQFQMRGGIRGHQPGWESRLANSYSSIHNHFLQVYRMIKMTEQEFIDMRENSGGVCRTCQERADGCEPDARNYRCDACEENQVFGVEELLIMGEIDIYDQKLDERPAKRIEMANAGGGPTAESISEKLVFDEGDKTVFYTFDPYAGWVETKTDKKVAELRKEWKGEMAD